MAEALETTALRLVAAYVEAHPELPLKEALRAATLLEGGVKFRGEDDGPGRFKIVDDLGRELVTIDLTSWLPPMEGR